MASLNSVRLIGNIGKDPDISHLPSGDQVVNFSIAVTKRWDKNGKKQERTSWFDIVCFSHTAKFVGNYLTKGQSVLVSGELQQRVWEGDDGKKRYKIEIIARDVQPLYKKADNSTEDEEVPF